jgi:hypothetical protein
MVGLSWCVGDASNSVVLRTAQKSGIICPIFLSSLHRRSSQFNIVNDGVLAVEISRSRKSTRVCFSASTTSEFSRHLRW